MRVRSLLREARRRKIYTTVVAYVALGGATIQLASSIFPAMELPDWGLRFLIILLALFFPIVVALAWIFDIGPGGIQRTGTILGADAKGSRAAAGAGAAWHGTIQPPVADQPKPIELIEEAPDPERVRRASLAFVRHELRSPINAIIGYGEMLLEDAAADSDDVAAADLTRIIQCGREILSLVDSNLDAERVSAEQGRDLESYGEQIRADLRDPLSAVRGYTEMLIESAGEEGRSARAADLRRILAAAARLLEISNDIAELVTHASDAAPADMLRGATLAEGVLAKIRAVQNAQTEADRHGSLLVVDDSAMNRDLLARQLARKGYFVTTAESGAQALEQMASQPFDLVLLDVLMPDLDGVGVLARMKSDARLRDIPVIMLSALDEVDSVVRCLEMGAADFVSKPFHPTLLEARINSTMLAHAERRTSEAALFRGSDATVTRLMAGTLPAYVIERLGRGESRMLDGVANAAAFFVDIDYAVAAADPAQRAALTEMLIEAARDAAHEEGAEILLHGIGLALVAGFPQPDPDAAGRIARTALRFTQAARDAGLTLRSGIHVGAVYASLVGKEQLSYFAWGDAIDLSRRLALSADRGEISISAACHAALGDEFVMANRGVVDVAGRGQMRAFVLKGAGALAT